MIGEIDLTFILALGEPPYARPDYFVRKQKESGIDKYVFTRKMIDAAMFWLNRIGREGGWPILIDTNGVLKGHLFKEDINGLIENVKAAFLPNANKSGDNSIQRDILIKGIDKKDLTILKKLSESVKQDNIGSAIQISTRAVKNRIRKMKDLSGVNDIDALLEVFRTHNLIK